VRVQAHLRCGGRVHQRGVLTIRDCGEYLEISRPGQSPHVLRAAAISRIEVEPEDSALVPCCEAGQSSAA
jgi:hypothetical protein